MASEDRYQSEKKMSVWSRRVERNVGTKEGSDDSASQAGNREAG
jgi:hypothetical protein